MKKDFIKKTIEEGGFLQIKRQAVVDSKLTDPGLRLLMLMLNNSTDWKINTTYFGRLLGWSPKKLSNATNNLIECGYLTKTKQRQASGAFVYQYSICDSPYSLCEGGVCEGGIREGGESEAYIRISTDKNKEEKNKLDEIEIGLTSKSEGGKVEVESFQDPTNQPKIISIEGVQIDGVQIETEEQIKAVKKVIAKAFKIEEAKFQSEEEMNKQFKGFIKTVVNKQFLNGKGQFVDNWASYSKMIVKGLLEGKYNFSFNEQFQPKPISNSSSFQINNEAIIQLITDACSDRELSTFEVVGGVETFIQPITAELGFQGCFRLLQQVKAEDGVITLTTVNEALKKLLFAQAEASGVGLRYGA